MTNEGGSVDPFSKALKAICSVLRENTASYNRKPGLESELVKSEQVKQNLSAHAAERKRIQRVVARVRWTRSATSSQRFGKGL